MDNLIGVLVALISAIMKIQSVPLDELNSSIYSFQKPNSSIYLTSFVEKINILNLVCLFVKIKLNLEKYDI